MSKLVTLSVTVPEDAADLLYNFVADLHSGRGERASSSEGQKPAAQTEDLTEWTVDDMGLYKVKIWDRLTRPAKSLFEALEAIGDREVGGDELASLIGLETGRHGVAGLLGRPGTLCKEAGRKWCWSFALLPETGTFVYSLDEAQAALVRGMRSSVTRT